MEMFKRIVLVDYKLPKQLQGNNAGDLVQKLLVRKVPDRLGMLSHRHYDIRDHPWFSESGCPYKKLLKIVSTSFRNLTISEGFVFRRPSGSRPLGSFFGDTKGKHNLKQNINIFFMTLPVYDIIHIYRVLQKSSS